MVSRVFVRNTSIFMAFLFVIFAIYYSISSGEFYGSIFIWVLFSFIIFLNYKEFKHQEYIDDKHRKKYSPRVEKQLNSFIGYRYSGWMARIGVILMGLVWVYFLYIFSIGYVKLYFLVVITIIFLFLGWYSLRRSSSLVKGRLYDSENK